MRGLSVLLSKCFKGSNKRRLGIGMFSGRNLRRVLEGPRGCPRTAVHMSKCTLRLTGTAGRRVSSLLRHIIRNSFWLGAVELRMCTSGLFYHSRSKLKVTLFPRQGIHEK